jgi:hypothetical protein
MATSPKDNAALAKKYSKKLEVFFKDKEKVSKRFKSLLTFCGMFFKKNQPYKTSR